VTLFLILHHDKHDHIKLFTGISHLHFTETPLPYLKSEYIKIPLRLQQFSGGTSELSHKNANEVEHIRRKATFPYYFGRPPSWPSSWTSSGRRLKLGDTHPRTLESWHNLIELYEAWDKPEKAEKWRVKLPQTENVSK